MNRGASVCRTVGGEPHEDVLMSAETVDAAFMTDRKKKIEKKFIKIKQGKWRDACVEDAKNANGITAENAEDIVTDNFLCSGGTEPTRDDIACRGDSGGATFVVPGKRMVQVGIISWGVKDLCASDPNSLSDPQSRDYHTNLFSAEVRSFLKNYLGNGTLGTPLTFIDEDTSEASCGLHRDYDDESHKRRQYPWLAKFSVTHNNGKISNCMGSLVTSTFILTAAHCFRVGDTPDRITVDIGSNIKVKRYISHPRYNIKAKEQKGIPEYYEFDVALIQLEKPVIMGLDLWPICIPCTKETSDALRLSDSEGTCRKHQDVLMSGETVDAAFMTEREKKIEKKFIKIKQGKWRDACVEDAKNANGTTAKNAEDIVTDNFLCSGGNKPTTDDIACKGDSGGATFVVPGKRMVQVGIISWGVKDLCARDSRASSDAHSRDYHTNLFSADVLSFLKEYLKDGTLGTPLTFL